MPRISASDSFFSLHKVRGLARRRTSDSPISPVHEAAPASAVFPSLQRLDTGRDMSPSRPPPAAVQPVLTLHLSRPSFLDTQVRDGASDNNLFAITTRGRKTFIHRTVRQDDIEQVACIRWPTETNALLKEVSTGITIQLGGGLVRPKPVEEFLRFAGFFNSRKFNLPHYNGVLKWKKINGNFHLSTSAVKGTIAVLEPAVLSAPPRIKIYEPLYNPDPSRPQLHHSGVPIVLLDYIVTTALLLVTDEEEWLNYALDNGNHSASVSSPSVAQTFAKPPKAKAAPTVVDNSPSTDIVEQWRHRVHAEHVLNRASSTGSRPSSPASSQHTTPSAHLERISMNSSGTSSFTNVDNPQTPASGPSHPFAFGYTGGSTGSPDEIVPPVPEIPAALQYQYSPQASSSPESQSYPHTSYSIANQIPHSYNPNQRHALSRSISSSKPSDLPPAHPLPMSPGSPPTTGMQSGSLPRARRELPRIPSHQTPLAASFHAHQFRQVSLPLVISPGSSSQATPSPPPVPRDYPGPIQGQLPPVLDDSFRSHSVPAKLAQEYQRHQPLPPPHRPPRPETMGSLHNYRQYVLEMNNEAIRPSTSASASTNPTFTLPPSMHSVYSPTQSTTFSSAISASSPMYTRRQPSVESQWQSVHDTSGVGSSGATEGAGADGATVERRQTADEVAHGVSNLSLATVLEDVGGYGQNRRSAAYDAELPPPAYDSINWSGPTLGQRNTSVL